VKELFLGVFLTPRWGRRSLCFAVYCRCIRGCSRSVQKRRRELRCTEAQERVREYSSIKSNFIVLIISMGRACHCLRNPCGNTLTGVWLFKKKKKLRQTVVGGEADEEPSSVGITSPAEAAYEYKTKILTGPTPHPDEPIEK